MMKKFMLSCEEITHLMEKKCEEKLSLKERMELFIHSMMCDACRAYDKQSRLLESLFKIKNRAETIDETEINSDQLEEKILQQLNKNPRTYDDNQL